MEPASGIIRKLGGEAVVREITGTAFTAAYRWQHSKEKGGTGGTIPQKYHRMLLEYALAHNIELTAADFLPPVAAPVRRKRSAA